MARRVMRSFTLSSETSDALDRLMETPPEREVLSTLLQTTNSIVTLDENSLSKADYTHFYSLLPRTTPGTDVKGLTRDPVYTVFSAHLSRCSEVNPGLMPKVLREMNARIRLNKRIKEPPINVSRIVDAILLPAIVKLYEGDRKSEAATGSRSYAKESRNKLSIRAGRKDAAV